MLKRKTSNAKASAATTAPAGKKSHAGKKARFSGPVPPVAAAASKPAASKKSKTKPVKVIPTPAAPSTFIVSAGSYERLLYGLSCTFVAGEEAGLVKLQVTPVFSFPAHLSSIKSVASSVLVSPGTGSERKVGGKYLVSGGTDEIIKVWDLKRKKEVGSLDGEATGTITCLRFVPQRNMLLAASTESAITIYRVRDWVLLRSLKAHKGRVNSVDAHPDGRVALSVGQDKMLRMWDLVAGKAVATLKLGEEGDLVRWNTNGTKFAVICASTLTIYGTDMSVHHTLTATSRFHDLRFCFFPIDATDPSQREYLFVACEDGNTRVFDISTSAATAKAISEDEDEDEAASIEAVAMLTGHSNRVKMMDLLEVALPSVVDGEVETTIVLTTASSDGKINLYNLADLKLARATAIVDPVSAVMQVVEVVPAATFDTDKSRLTCVCAVGVVERKNREGDAAEEEDDEEDDSEDDGGMLVHGDDEDDEDDSEGSFKGIASDSDEAEGEGEVEFGEEEEEEEE